jgi:hypothetical protein
MEIIYAFKEIVCMQRTVPRACDLMIGLERKQSEVFAASNDKEFDNFMRSCDILENFFGKGRMG